MVVPYSKITVVEAPLGFTVPFRVAEVAVTEVADPEVAVGEVGAEVENVTSLP